MHIKYLALIQILNLMQLNKNHPFVQLNTKILLFNVIECKIKSKFIWSFQNYIEASSSMQKENVVACKQSGGSLSLETTMLPLQSKWKDRKFKKN